MIEHKKLPVNHHITSLYDPAAWIFNEFEYAQPPVYYLINIPAALLPNPMLGSRLLSVLISSITLWLLIISALQIFRRYELGAVLMTSLAGLNPIFLRIGSSVSNDNLAWFLSLIVFRLFLQDREFKRKWLFGLLIGLGILTKASFLIWVIFPFLRILLARKEWRKISLPQFANPIFTSVTAFVLCGWWLVRNRTLYGDWTGIVGGSGLPGEFLNTASLYVFQDFLKSALQFTIFPVIEEHSSFILPISGFILFLVVGFFVQFRQLDEEFNDKRDLSDFMLFTILNLLFFVYANLHWNLSETRHLAIGLLPLISIVCAVLMRTLGKFSVPLALLVNATYLSVLW